MQRKIAGIFFKLLVLSTITINIAYADCDVCYESCGSANKPSCDSIRNACNSCRESEARSRAPAPNPLTQGSNLVRHRNLLTLVETSSRIIASDNLRFSRVGRATASSLPDNHTGDIRHFGTDCLVVQNHQADLLGYCRRNGRFSQDCSS